MNSPNFHAADSALLELARVLQRNQYHFTTPTPATHARVNARPENARAQNLTDVFGWSRPFAREFLAPEILEPMQRAGVLLPNGDLWRSAVRFSRLNGQLFVHSAFPTVEPDSVFFGPDTYRYATAIAHYFQSASRPILRAVDIGCGSGAGAILVASLRPAAQVLAVDINQQALRFTRINAALNGVQNVEASYSDLLSDVDGKFDLIVANPPYLVDESERAYRHGGGPLGAGLSLQIVDAALERLASSGTLLLYTGAAIVDGADPFLREIKERFVGNDLIWDYNEMDVDVFGEELDCAAYAHTDRIAAVVLEMTKK